MPKCKSVGPYCRKISPGGKAKSPCTKTVRGHTVSGTRIARHSRPKDCHLKKLQAAARGRSARRKRPSSKRKASHSPVRRTSKRVKRSKKRLNEEI